MYFEIYSRAKDALCSASNIINKLYNSKIIENEYSGTKNEEYKLAEDTYRYFLSQLEYLITELNNEEEKENTIYALEEVIQNFVSSSDKYIEMCKKAYFRNGYFVASELIYDTTREIPTLE